MQDSNIPEIGVITGNFDIIHPGYIEMFEDAKSVCDYLIIALQSDATIDRPEKNKPVQTLVKSLRPDVRLMGDDYIGKKFTGDDLGILIKWVDRSHGWSTTKFKQAIANSCK